MTTRRGYRGNGRERDDQDRFMSDDDLGYRSRRSRYDEDDDRRYRGNDRERDDQGRFMSDDRRYHSRRSRYDDEDDRGGPHSATEY
ncbi:MAG: hypothetical protein JO339_00755 [Alphaproteobacteria bacterium]|nr:hypothetical protein [Alphaproteobacteria bacterium]